MSVAGTARTVTEHIESDDEDESVNLAHIKVQTPSTVSPPAGHGLHSPDNDEAGYYYSTRRQSADLVVAETAAAAAVQHQLEQQHQQQQQHLHHHLLLAQQRRQEQDHRRNGFRADGIDSSLTLDAQGELLAGDDPYLATDNGGLLSLDGAAADDDIDLDRSRMSRCRAVAS